MANSASRPVFSCSRVLAICSRSEPLAFCFVRTRSLIVGHEESDRKPHVIMSLVRAVRSRVAWIASNIPVNVGMYGTSPPRSVAAYSSHGTSQS
jgi:hypothetical protein